ncbi:MAG: hypothetical protein IPL95_01425 [Saprospiraceae bacterium]|nr:hypothetical protein [Saprospiraceae bacterium]
MKRYIILKLILICNCLSSQNVPFIHYSTRDGLPQTQILSLFEDSRGYTWIGCSYDLYYFDGKNFKNVTEKMHLPYYSIFDIDEDKNGNIIFNVTKWMCKYDGNKITFNKTNIVLRDNNFCVDKDGIGWCINNIDKKIYYSFDFITWEKANINENQPDWHFISYNKKYNRFLLNDFDKNLYEFKSGHIKNLHKKIILPSFNDPKNNLDLVSSNDSIFEIDEHKINFLFGKHH